VGATPRNKENASVFTADRKLRAIYSAKQNQATHAN